MTGGQAMAGALLLGLLLFLAAIATVVAVTRWVWRNWPGRLPPVTVTDGQLAPEPAPAAGVFDPRQPLIGHVVYDPARGGLMRYGEDGQWHNYTPPPRRTERPGPRL